MFNLILPCILITGIALMSFYMPSDSGEKVIISMMTVFIMFNQDPCNNLKPGYLIIWVRSSRKTELEAPIFFSILNVSLCSFFLQVTLGITTLLSMTVFLMVISRGKMPKQNYVICPFFTELILVPKKLTD